MIRLLPDRPKKCIRVCDICGSEKEIYIGEREASRCFREFGKDICKKCLMKFANQVGWRNSSAVITAYNKSTKGQNFDARFGLEKSKEIKSKLSQKTSGASNPMFGKTYQAHGIIDYAKSTKGKSLEEIHGVKRAKDIRKRISSSLIGEKNPMFGKPAPIGSGKGWSGWYNNFYFRSLLELTFILMTPNIKSAESLRIPYIDVLGHRRNYIPDFLSADSQILYEIKPKKLVNTKSNKRKFSAARRFCKKNKISFQVVTDDEIQVDFSIVQKLYEDKKIIFIERYDALMKQIIEAERQLIGA